MRVFNSSSTVSEMKMEIKFEKLKLKYHIIIFAGIVYHLGIMYCLYLCATQVLKMNSVRENVSYNRIVINVKSAAKQQQKQHQAVSAAALLRRDDFVRNATVQRYVAGHRSFSDFICPESGKKLKLIILITSAVNHSGARVAIRSTWAYYKSSANISIGFVIGSTTNRTLQQQINAENDIYRDIIQGTPLESLNMYEHLATGDILVFDLYRRILLRG